MTSYYWWLLGSALICMGMFVFLSRKISRHVQLALLTLLLGAVLGTVCAKLVYYLTQIDFMIANGWLRSLAEADPAQWCFSGGVMGAVLGAYLAAKLLHVKPSAALDAFAPAGVLMAALARFGGYFLQDAMIGLGEYLENPALCFFPLAVVNEWGEYYLAVFMLEGAWALAVTALSLFSFKSHRFARTVFYLCLGQIFFESLHSDSISWLFVRVEQLLSMLAMAWVILCYIRWMKDRKGWTALAVCAACAGLFVGVEFALDKTSWPIPAIYGAMLLGMAVLAVTEIRCMRAVEKHN